MFKGTHLLWNVDILNVEAGNAHRETHAFPMPGIITCKGIDEVFCVADLNHHTKQTV